MRSTAVWRSASSSTQVSRYTSRSPPNGSLTSASSPSRPAYSPSTNTWPSPPSSSTRARWCRAIVRIKSAPSTNSRVRSCARWPERSSHRAQLLTRELVDGADLILTMARHHRARVDELGGEGHVFVLGEYAGREGDDAEVSDPFGGDLDVYRDTCVEREALLQTAVERIVKEFASGSQR